MAELPLVSAIVPCRNEERYISQCLDSIVANDYPKDKLEVLVVDGNSEDRTRKIVAGYQQRYESIRLLDNVKKITPVAMNIGIKNARGMIIMKMDAHTTYEKDYISKCVKFLYEYNADNVGGILQTVPGAETTMAKAIALALSNPFGAGNSYFRIGSKEPRWVDTVSFGCYRREIFDKIGVYNEKLVRSQDMDLNIRLTKAGGKILLHPEIVGRYYADPDLGVFAKHNFADGVWVIQPLKFGGMFLRPRHLIPLAFVLSLVGSALLSIFFPVFLWLFLSIVGLYLAISIYFSFRLLARERKLSYPFVMPIVFLTRHIAYGAGSFYGLLKLLVSKEFWRKRLGKRARS
jgi:glycosyltransferase involved in cell wall biosynthesis